MRESSTAFPCVEVGLNYRAGFWKLEPSYVGSYEGVRFYTQVIPNGIRENTAQRRRRGLGVEPSFPPSFQAIRRGGLSSLHPGYALPDLTHF